MGDVIPLRPDDEEPHAVLQWRQEGEEPQDVPVERLDIADGSNPVTALNAGQTGLDIFAGAIDAANERQGTDFQILGGSVEIVELGD